MSINNPSNCVNCLVCDPVYLFLCNVFMVCVSEFWSVGWIPEIMSGVRGCRDKEGKAAGCCEEGCVSATEDRGNEYMYEQRKKGDITQRP